MAARYRAIYRGGKLYAEYDGDTLTYLTPDYVPAPRSGLPSPSIMRDIGEYKSPLDGKMITSRSQHRDHMREHDVIEVGNEPIGKMTPPNTDPKPREIGEIIKRRVEEVKAMPQAQYDAQVKVAQNAGD